MALRFNPPPGWPTPEDFVPGPGWQPDPSWPPLPAGWQLWVPDDVPAEAAVSDSGSVAPPGGWPLPAGEAGPQAQPTSAEAGYWVPPSTVPGAFYQPPGPGAAAPPPTDTSGLAIAAFVLGVIGFLVITGIVGIVLGVAALRRIRSSLQGGWLVLLVVLIAIGAAVGFSFSVGTLPSGSHEIPVTALVTGDCFDFPTSSAAQGVMFVDQTPCNQPHNSQIVATFPVTGSAGAYPGVKRLSALAVRGCGARVQGKLDSAQMNAAMSGRFLYPLADSWRGGMRTISCVIYSPTSISSSVLKQ